MKKFKRLILRFLMLLVLAGLVLSLLMVLPFRWINPPLTMVMAERWINSDSQQFYLQQDWLNWDEIPKQAALAVVTSEDQRFPIHHGLDIDAIIKAIKAASKGGDLRGASTISQ